MHNGVHCHTNMAVIRCIRRWLQCDKKGLVQHVKNSTWTSATKGESKSCCSKDWKEKLAQLTVGKVDHAELFDLQTTTEYQKTQDKPSDGLQSINVIEIAN